MTDELNKVGDEPTDDEIREVLKGKPRSFRELFDAGELDGVHVSTSTYPDLFDTRKDEWMR